MDPTAAHGGATAHRSDGSVRQQHTRRAGPHVRRWPRLAASPRQARCLCHGMRAVAGFAAEPRRRPPSLPTGLGRRTRPPDRHRVRIQRIALRRASSRASASTPWKSAAGPQQPCVPAPPTRRRQDLERRDADVGVVEVRKVSTNRRASPPNGRRRARQRGARECGSPDGGRSLSPLRQSRAGALPRINSTAAPSCCPRGHRACVAKGPGMHCRAWPLLAPDSLLHAPRPPPRAPVLQARHSRHMSIVS